jgi:putative ATP-binding cassette transporter
MDSKLLDLIREGTTPKLRRRVVLTAVTSGIASVAVLAIINAASHSSEYGTPLFRYFAMFASVIAAYVYCLRYTFDTTTRIFEDILDKTRRRIINKIRNSELDTLDHIGRSEIYSRLTQDTAMLSQLEGFLTGTIQSASMLFFMSLYIVWLSEYAFLLTLLLMIGGVTIYLRADKAAKEQIEYTSQMEVELFDHVTYLIDGFQEVRLNRQRSNELYEDTEDVSQALKESKVFTARHYNDNYVLSQAFFYFHLAAIVFVLPQLIPTFADTITQITMVIVFIIGPLGVVVSSIPAYFKANIAAEHIYSLEERLDQLQQTPPSEAFVPIDSFSTITLTDVEFSYDKNQLEQFKIGPISFDLKAGEILFLVGGNGSGKSTLLKVLTSLYQPQQGTLKIDHRLVSGDAVHGYREMFSAVFSDFHLFGKLYGLRDLDPGQVNALLERMQLDTKTAYVDGRFTSLNLSTGQRKRMGLLIALLEDKPICVFDEWAAEQDPEFRSYFYEELLHQLKEEGKTIIAVSHDDRYFHHADKIIKMEYGQLVKID